LQGEGDHRQVVERFQLAGNPYKTSTFLRTPQSAYRLTAFSASLRLLCPTGTQQPSRQARPLVRTVLSCRFGRCWACPTGAQQPSRQARKPRVCA